MAKTDAGGAGGIGPGGGDQTAQNRTVPINEELLEKAQQESQEEQQQDHQSDQQSDQQQIEALKQQVATLQAQLLEAEQAIIHTQRHAEIERELNAARALDIETATLLTEAAIAEMEPPDVATAVRELRTRKPFLFANPRAAHSGGLSMSPAPNDDDHNTISSIAQRARVSGDRAELLRYLRARRTT